MKRVMVLVVSVTLFAALPIQAQETLLKTGAQFVRSDDNFVASSHFIVNSSLYGIVPSIPRIGGLERYFEEFFLGKTERNVRATLLTRYHVQKMSVDAELRAMIDDWGPLQLSHLWQLLVDQPNGENGFLLTNGSLNYFHIGGTDGRVWILFAYWRDDRGWIVHAAATLGPYVVMRGSQVITLGYVR